MSDGKSSDNAAGGFRAGALGAFFARSERAQRQRLAVVLLGIASVFLWILSLYFDWTDRVGPTVHDVPNLWFNCIPLGALAMTLFCVWRPRHRTAGAVALIGLTVGLFYIVVENSFGMFTYNADRAAAGFWLGLTAYIVLLVAAVNAGLLVNDECCRGCRPDGRPRSPWLVLGLGTLGIGLIVARFLPDYVIGVERTPISDSGEALSQSPTAEILHRGMVGRLDGAEFIPEITGWVVFLLAAPLAAWLLRRQLAAAFIGGFLVYFVAKIAAALAVDYASDYSDDLDNGLQITVDYGLGDGFLALLATTVLFVLIIGAISLTGSEHPGIADSSTSADS